MLLPALLTDLLFAGKERDAEIAVEESNPAMSDLLRRYGEAILQKAGQGGRMNVNADRKAILRGADCVLYAGDPQAASRFAMDRSALGSDREEEGDSGLTDQARVNGGIGGLMHALRAGTAVFRLCDEMAESCPEALVINLGQPVARTTELFVRRGFRCYGLGDSPLRGPIGLEAIRKLLKTDGKKEEAVIAGLPGFAFLLSLKEDGQDKMPRLRRAVREGKLGNLSRRWLNWWDAVPVGDATAHAEFLPAQPDYIPAERPSFGESVERRKERILYMNTVAEQGADAREGAMAQLLLLSKAPAARPVQLALAVLRRESVTLPAVVRKNRGELPQLPEEAVIEADLTLRDGREIPHGTLLPASLAEAMREIDEANRLAAEAAAGDRQALREYVETDPALAGLDRLYCQEVVEALIRLHADMLGEETTEQT